MKKIAENYNLLREKSYGCYSHRAIALKYWRDF